MSVLHFFESLNLWPPFPLVPQLAKLEQIVVKIEFGGPFEPVKRYQYYIFQNVHFETLSSFPDATICNL